MFCASLADVFDEEVPHEWRADLFDLIRQTPNLDWLLLTKRPQNILAHIGQAAKVAASQAAFDFLDRWLAGRAPSNVWLGTSVENQAAADERIPALLEIPAAVRFLSCEPLLGPVNLTPWLGRDREDELGDYDGVDWCIVGGESGTGARPMAPAWAHDIMLQCVAAGTSFFFKQWGEYAPLFDITEQKAKDAVCGSFVAGEMVPNERGSLVPVYRVGKKAAGRLLAGRAWNEMPKVTVTT